MKIRISNISVKLIFAAVAFCSVSSAAFAAVEDEYVFILRTRGNPYWNTVAQGIQDAAREKKTRVTVYQAQTETSGEEQLQVCLTALERKPKFIGLTAVNTSVGLQCLKKAQEAGVAIAELDSTIPIDEAEKAGVRLAFSIGSDNEAIGRKAAVHAATLLGKDAAQILVLEGAVGSEPGRMRVKGFKEKIAVEAPAATIVTSVSAEWDRLKAMTISADALQRFPNLKLIYAVNDLMALGAVEALKEQGKSGVYVIGVDGTADARRAVSNGQMAATVAQVPYLLGRRAAELALQAVAGEKIPLRETTDTPVLTKAILENKNSPELTYVR